MKKIYSIFLLALLVFSGCKKIDFDMDINGEAVGNFSLSAPADNAMLVLNSGTPNNTVTIQWTTAKPGVSAEPTYKWVAALKTGNIDAPILEIPSDNSGKSNKLTLTQKVIDDALKAKGIAEGVKTDLIWSVIADNGSVKLKATANYNISITRFGDGISNFKLYGPLPSNNTLEINPSSTSDLLTFKWQKAFPGKAASGITYKIKFVKKGESFNTPLMEFNSNNSGADSTFTISYKAMDEALSAAGLNDQGTTANLQWSVEAKSGSYTKFADYVNNFSLVREVKMFIVGDATPANWTIENALQMIPDVNNSGTFYIYVKLGSGGFKFVNQRQWPGGSLNSSDWGQKKGAAAGIADVNDEDNINSPGPGIYRITFDSKNLTYAVSSAHGAMAIVGGGTNAGWNPGNAVANQSMSYLSVNKYIGLIDLNGGEYKFIDGNDWPNSSNKNRDYGTKTNGVMDGKLVEQGDNNLLTPAGGAGRYRVVFDASNVKDQYYYVSAASEMRIVGGGFAPNVPEWSPGSSPQMTYQGNGVWTLTITLNAGKEFKFLAGNDWGAFDYEDAGNGKIKWTGGDNFKTPNATGTYTITLNEYNGTYTITQ